jgi:hypothetical protein
MTITFNALSQSIPSLKQAARELSIDFISGNPDGAYTEITVLISDYYQLVLLGTIAGINTSHTTLKNPLNDIMNSLQKGIDKVQKSKNNPDDNKL